MKISVEQLLVIRQRDFNALNRAFSVGLGGNYKNPEYTPTRDDLKKVAMEIEKIVQESETTTGFFGNKLSGDEQMDNIREANTAAMAFQDLYHILFSE